MKVAHLILVHKDPAQVLRLVNALQHPAFDIYIHIDKKVQSGPFVELINVPNVIFIKDRVRVKWGGWGTVQATLNGFTEILIENYDYINIISGQDFPLRSPEQIYSHLISKAGTEFITCDKVNEEWDVASRLEKYHFINWSIPGKFRLSKILSSLLPKRTFPLSDHTIVGRANWFTITTAAAIYSVSFLHDHPEVVRYFKYCWGADEFIFSTILYNSHFKDSIQDNLVYVDWSGPLVGHPKVLTLPDLEALLSSPNFFARKFDQSIDNGVLLQLERNIKE